MMKSRQSATKLRLSRLVKCLIGLGCLKLAIMATAFIDLPMPAWWGAKQTPVSATQSIQPEPAPMAVREAVNPALEVQEQAAAAPVAEAIPQGSEAAELATAARPRKQPGVNLTQLPAPLVSADPFSAINYQSSASGIPLLPEPAPLGKPLVSAGVILPQQETGTETARGDDSIWNILDLKSLPIPGLGSVQAAHAAALDMPVPAAPRQASPFTPAEQLAPTGGKPIVMPGAPPLPDNIPRGQTASGQPLPQRLDGGQTQAPFPVSPEKPLNAPAPAIPQAANSHINVNSHAQELARQQQDLLVLRQQMDQRLKELQSAEDKMKDMLREANDQEEKKVKSLVQMYANMKPRMAAQALENMDERVAVRILGGMAPKQSGEILTYTNPAKTAKFTEMLTRLRTE